MIDLILKSNFYLKTIFPSLTVLGLQTQLYRIPQTYAHNFLIVDT